MSVTLLCAQGTLRDVLLFNRLQPRSSVVRGSGTRQRGVEELADKEFDMDKYPRTPPDLLPGASSKGGGRTG